MADEEKKIIVDEDWKTRVQKEKEELQKKLEEEKEKKAGDSGTSPLDTEVKPSFEAIVGILTTDAMLALGVIAPPGAKEVVIDLDQAQFFIDLLMILRDKTKGNLTPREEGILNNSIAQLQEIFVVRTQQYHEAQLQQSGLKPDLKTE